MVAQLTLVRIVPTELSAGVPGEWIMFCVLCRQNASPAVKFWKSFPLVDYLTLVVAFASV